MSRGDLLETNRFYFFISVPMVFLFWLILNMMFGGLYAETVPKEIDISEMLASPVFIIMIVLSILELGLIWKWAIPLAKMDPQNHLIAYILPEMCLLFGFIAGFSMMSVTPYFYFLPLWLIGMAMVYREIYSMP